MCGMRLAAGPQGAGLRGDQMTPTVTTPSNTEPIQTERATPAVSALSADKMIVFEDVSKFYGEVLGVNRVNLQIAPGITSLVGPNGSGKTTLMNLMTGLLRPSSGRISVLGTSPDDPEAMFQKIGYCSQFDSFPRGATAREFIEFYLRVHGYTKQETDELTQSGARTRVASRGGGP